jgi:hypothetical protein
MGSNVLKCCPMIDQKCLLSAVLLGLPIGTSALDLRDRPVTGMLVVPAAAVPAETPEARIPAPRLRDSLKQPVSDAEHAGKPYRLSPEERQRLREQLRALPEQSAHNQ